MEDEHIDEDELKASCELSDEELANAVVQADLLARMNADSGLEKAFRKAIVVRFAIKYVLAIAVYMLLKHFNAGFFIDVWVSLVFALGLYHAEQYVNILVKRDLISQVVQEMKDEESKSSGDIEDSSKEQA